MPVRRQLDDGSHDEDTEGHAIKGKLDDGSNGGKETEGHIYKPGRLDDGSNGGDEAEGHVYRPGRIDDGSGDDAEGHAARVKL
jgi:hypothetical protein